MHALDLRLENVNMLYAGGVVSKAEITQVTTVADVSANLHNTRFQISRGAGAWGAGGRCALVMDCSSDPAQQIFTLFTGAGSLTGGTWTLGDWTGPYDGIPAPSGWQANNSLSNLLGSGAMILTGYPNGVRTEITIIDTSSLLMADGMGEDTQWNGAVVTASFSPGRDSITATGGSVTDISVAISVNALDTDVATAIGTTAAGTGPSWSTAVVSNVVTLTDSSTGTRTDAADGTPPTGFSISITQQGA